MSSTTEPRGRGEDASSHAILFIVAGAIFVGAFAILAAQLDDASDRRVVGMPVDDRMAADIASLLVDSRGTWTCSEPPTLVGERFGLAASTGGLEPCKLRALRNGTLSYEEVRGGLAVPEGTHIHIRMVPLLRPYDPVIGQTTDPNSRLAMDVGYVTAPDGSTRENETKLLEDLVTVVDETPSSADLGGLDALVVGSDVDHGTLAGLGGTDLQNWVHAGGTLIVLPSTASDGGWLAALWSSQATVESERLLHQDPGLPVLNHPNSLGWPLYPASGDLASLGASPSAFHAAGDPSDPVLHVSRPGAFGEGQVLLVHVDPLAPHGQREGPERHRLMQNLLAQHFADVFLDFGRQGPEDFPLATGARTSYVHLNEGPYGPSTIGVRLFAHLFPGPEDT